MITGTYKHLDSDRWKILNAELRDIQSQLILEAVGQMARCRRIKGADVRRREASTDSLDALEARATVVDVHDKQQGNFEAESQGHDAKWLEVQMVEPRANLVNAYKQIEVVIPRTSQVELEYTPEKQDQSESPYRLSSASYGTTQDSLLVETQAQEPFSQNSQLCLDGLITERSPYPEAGGGYADVWTGMLCGNAQVAIKVLRRFSSEGVEIHHDKMMKRVWREYLAWSSLRHPNILRCLGFSYDFSPATEFKFPALISPWMSQGLLLSYLARDPEIDRIPLIRGILKALVFLHDHVPPIVHGDVRAGNVLMSSEGVPCLTDFGLSRLVGDASGLTTSSNVAGSLRWMAPELLHNETPSMNSDVWAFGMTVLEILTGKPPYYMRSDPVVMMNIISGVLPFRPEPTDAPALSTHLWKLCEECWESNPYQRPPIRQIQLQMAVLCAQKTRNI